MKLALNFTAAKVVCLLSASAVLSACEQQITPQAGNATPGYEVVTDIQQTMAWILDPAADVIWDSAGTIITVEGEEDLSPTTEEGWNQVLHAAATLAEAGNLLMLPGRSAGDDWVEYAKGLTQASKAAMSAAQAMDADALFDAGGKIYQVCRACHNQYWVKDSKEGDS